MKTLNAGDKISLIAEDFTLDKCTADFDLKTREPGTSQYYDNRDCPIARALKRAGAESFMVFPYNVTGLNIGIAGDYYDVERCRLELLAGAEEAFINVTELS
jgi:hypothetical protein